MLETIHEIIKESVSNGFWNFAGYWIMIGLIFGIPAKVIISIAEIIILKNKILKFNTNYNDKNVDKNQNDI